MELSYTALVIGVMWPGLFKEAERNEDTYSKTSSDSHRLFLIKCLSPPRINLIEGSDGFRNRKGGESDSLSSNHIVLLSAGRDKNKLQTPSCKREALGCEGKQPTFKNAPAPLGSSDYIKRHAGNPDSFISSQSSNSAITLGECGGGVRKSESACI